VAPPFEEADDAEAPPHLHRIYLTKAKAPERVYCTACQCDGWGGHKQQLLKEFRLSEYGDRYFTFGQHFKAAVVRDNLSYVRARALVVGDV
jgi:hypothetical protein